MPRRPLPLRVAIDTGGTFTDCVWIDATCRTRMLKVFSTPADPSQAIVEVLKKIDHEGEFVILHGTTVGTNALLERKGALPDSKTPSRSAARRGPSSMICSLIALSRWSRRASVLESRNERPATAKF
jgi:hypothetical protein